MVVTFRELAGSPRETFSTNGTVAERTLVCAWSDRLALVNEILGGTTKSVYPAASGVFAVSVMTEPLADEQIAGAFSSLNAGVNSNADFAKLIVHYESAPTAKSSGETTAYLTYRREVRREAAAFPGGSVYLPQHPATAFPTEASGAVSFPIVVHRLTWGTTVNPPWEAIRACRGAVNASAFLGVPTGRLIFDGAEAKRTFDNLNGLANSNFGWSLEYIFREDSLYGVTDPVSYPSADFNALLQFDE